MESKLWFPTRHCFNSCYSFARLRFIWAILVLCAAVTSLALFALFNSGLPGQAEIICKPQLTVDPFDPRQAVNGPPTRSFRGQSRYHNLCNDTKYITSWGSGGWSNDVISIINLIYLGLVTDRIPILPIFLPSHLLLNTLGNAYSALNFRDVFDLPRLRKATGIPVLEWWNVKASNSTDLGCWNVWESVQYHEKAPRQSFAPWKLGLDISYTKTPDWVKMLFLVPRVPTTRAANLIEPRPSPKHNVSPPPDEDLLCYDFLYHVAAHQADEIALDYSPAWRYVGAHMHWTPILDRLGDTYIRQTLELRSTDPIPPVVHVRHNGFADWCEEGFSTDCLAPMSAIERRVREVQEEIAEHKGITHVILTSDEKNSTWWQEVYDLGWFRPDHSRTKELYRDWYPILIDAVIQSKSAGFVGTARTTMSILWVESWQDGAARMVQWGKPGADDH
ncbi:hypothetical protein DFH07DRAFT_774856 [Mycena maculata]|uniref:Uncharacterized protein n=1 Tax=Mycena maculata TaxID=230809 RepID=A0AAD7NA89_9AGAR|nr:hypothetical protein DFH07DRAFT_774856 [Mycena maculata]